MHDWNHGASKSNPSKRATLKGMVAFGLAAMAVSFTVGASAAESLLDKIKNGETIRIGFSNEIPWAYPGKNNEPLGYVNAMTLDILKKLGTTKVEPVVAEWGSLIPGLQAGRFDIITGGMSILPDRCRNVLFTNPIDKDPGALLVQKGNPKEVHSFEDVRDKGLIFVTGAGWASVAVAQKVGIAEDKIVQVAGLAEVLQAVKTGRADVGSGGYYTMQLAAEKDDSLEVPDPYTPPQIVVPGIPGYAALAFPLDQQAAVDAFNAVLKDYIGSDEMMESVGKYGYTKTTLPDSGLTAAELCKG
ncbi:ectoine/hydroxyectoine ABC transporter substrate-binding protein EhuB [Mesorhizobium sp.]|uniref:ectoine/hydroxyectoine ABC transporter substrate-binding protein EhuB n=1 Tax=Mesorhizobium sp. TaxID=1871066 RepID=UPI0026AC5529